MLVFAVLAGFMWLTRKLDWYGVGRSLGRSAEQAELNLELDPT